MLIWLLQLLDLLVPLTMKGLLTSHHKQHNSSVVPSGYITMHIILSTKVFVVVVVVVFVVSEISATTPPKWICKEICMCCSKRMTFAKLNSNLSFKSQLLRVILKPHFEEFFYQTMSRAAASQNVCSLSCSALVDLAAFVHLILTFIK